MTAFNKSHITKNKVPFIEIYSVLSVHLWQAAGEKHIKQAVERKEKRLSVKEGPIKMLIRDCKCVHLLNHPLTIKRVCHNKILQ